MSYDSVVLADAPTHYYATDEASGSTAVDGAGSADAALTGAHITYETAIFGQVGFEFSADGDTFFEAALDVAATGSFECLVRIYSDTGNWSFMGLAPSGDDIPSDKGNRALGTFFGNASLMWNGVGPSGGAALSADTDYHLVGVVHADGSSELYVNGSLSTSTSAGGTTPVATSGASLFFPMGVFDVAGGHIAIGKVAIWDGVALTSGQVAAHYAARNDVSGGGGGGTTAESDAGGQIVLTSSTIVDVEGPAEPPAYAVEPLHIVSPAVPVPTLTDGRPQ